MKNEKIDELDIKKKTNGKKKVKCYYCKKKCTLFNFQCGCGHTFCQIHRYPHSHSCKSTIKKNENLQTLEKNNPKMESNKIEAI